MTVKDLAKRVLRIQDACNLTGVLISASEDVRALRRLLEGSSTTFSTDDVNYHPISVLWASKIASLTGLQHMSDHDVFVKAYNEVIALAGE